MIKHCIRLTLALALVTFASSYASAQNYNNNRTKMTFSAPVEIPGRVLPAGTYWFQLDDTNMNRHIIEVYDEAGTKHIATVLAIPDYRLKKTSETVVRFNEVAAGQPEAIRAWFYPGRLVGEELVYSKKRAHALAAAANVVVPATADTTYTAPAPEKTTPDFVAVTPKSGEQPISTIQSTPPPDMPAATPPESTTSATPEELPHTASPLPAIALVGFGLLAVGFTLRRLGSSRLS